VITGGVELRLQYVYVGRARAVPGGREGERGSHLYFLSLVSAKLGDYAEEEMELSEIEN